MRGESYGGNSESDVDESKEKLHYLRMDTASAPHNFLLLNSVPLSFSAAFFIILRPSKCDKKLEQARDLTL